MASFAWLLPILAILVSAGLVATSYVRAYTRMSGMVRGAQTVLIRSGEFEMAAPRGRVPWLALYAAGLMERGPITLMNAPAYWIQYPVSLVIGHKPNWYPASLGSAAWRVLSFPFFAIPAWMFVGRGIDAFFKHRRISWVEMLISLICALLFVAISAGLRFGLSESERAGQELLSWYIAGFGWWSAVIAVPFGIWCIQRFTEFRDLSIRKKEA